MVVGDKEPTLRHDRAVPTPSREPMAAFPGTTARDLVEVTDDLAALGSGGRWAVAITFEGAVTLAKFSHWSDVPPGDAEVGDWQGPRSNSWVDSLPRDAYVAAVSGIRERIAAGDVYQVNLCRVLRAPVPDQGSADPAALWRDLSRGNPAPYEGFLRIPEITVISASPELFLSRDGDLISSGPIKGTAPTAAGLTAKDHAENIMIVDLVRNDLARVCRPGSVNVPHLLAVEQHPGLVHLVSTVSGRLQDGATWADILMATMPPGSVSGAPKISALEVIAHFEPVPRSYYCGAFGWIDADHSRAQLAVAIRSFWISDAHLHFGTGAGITWGSDPEAEWQETVLKARRLMSLANGA